MVARGVARDVRRGQVWWADLGLGENKRLLIVSNNERNAHRRDVIGLYVTSTKPRPLPSVASFGPGELGDSASSVLADDPWVIEKEFLIEPIGAAGPSQMVRVNAAMKVALGMS